MKLVNVCYPKVYKRFKLFPYWLNCITWKKGDEKIYRWLFWNWSFIEKKMKFTIFWLEYHNPMNWADCPELEEERDKLMALKERPDNICELLHKINEKIEQNGIKRITDSLPTKSWQYDPNEDDGWIEVSCEDTFEANSIEEAKKIASKYECGCEVFTVWQDPNYTDPVFTEEDLVGV